VGNAIPTSEVWKSWWLSEIGFTEEFHKLADEKAITVVLPLVICGNLGIVGDDLFR
jgi:hypothetical protein